MRPLLPIFAFGSAVIAAPALAALAPQHQRAAELRAVIADPGVGNAFAGVPIERVEFVRRDLYRVSAQGCRLDVAIVDLPTPPDVAGGRRFAVKAGRKLCGR